MADASPLAASRPRAGGNHYRLKPCLEVAEMHRGGGAEPRGAGRRLDSKRFANWHEDCTQWNSERKVVAMGDSRTGDAHSRKHFQAAYTDPQLSRLCEKSINTKSLHSLARLDPPCSRSGENAHSRELPRIEFERTGRGISVQGEGRVPVCTLQWTVDVSECRLSPRFPGEA